VRCWCMCSCSVEERKAMSGVNMLFRVVLVIVNYRNQIGWLLSTLMFLSLSILTIIVQLYIIKIRYMNVLDGLLLALMGF